MDKAKAQRKHRRRIPTDRERTRPPAGVLPLQDHHASLEQTRVYRKLPPDERARLDAAILSHPADRDIPDETVQTTALETRHGLTRADIRHYAVALHEFVRPLTGSVAISELMSVLPQRAKRRLLTSKQVLTWSRLVQHLTDTESRPLTAVELARIAGLFRCLRTNRGPFNRLRRGDPQASAAKAGEPLPGDRPPSEDLAALVRSVYGVSLASDAQPARR